MGSGHAVELALDLARMPALVRNAAKLPIPQDVIEVMQIAARSTTACQNAVVATGEPEAVLVEAARFYLQQLLFQPDADCYRVLGVKPGASRATVRNHMRWLMLWLHPDRNNELDAIYAERVLKAWREIAKQRVPVHFTGAQNKSLHRTTQSFPPWIKYPTSQPQRGIGFLRRVGLWKASIGLVLFVVILAVLYYFGVGQTNAYESHATTVTTEMPGTAADRLTLFDR